MVALTEVQLFKEQVNFLLCWKCTDDFIQQGQAHIKTFFKKKHNDNKIIALRLSIFFFFYICHVFLQFSHIHNW